MKTYLALISVFFLCVAAEPGYASTTTVVLDAGQLTSPTAAPMQVDNTVPSSNGSLLLLIDLGSSNTISNTLTPGAYVSGTNTILAAGGFNTNVATNETQTTFVIQGTPNVGDQVALRWFPQITYAQYQTGTVPAAGDYFGTYNPRGGNPDGGSTWTVPSPGSTVDFYFATTNSDLGGTQPPADGFASFQVTTSGSITFSDWQSTYFSTQQLGEPAVSGAAATPQNDGVPNLLKYVLDIDPTYPMTAADRAALPTVQVTGNGSSLTLTYRENPEVTGVTINAQTSTNLQNWTDISSQQLSTDPMTGDFIMQAQVALTGNRQFLRLNVISP